MLSSLVKKAVSQSIREHTHLIGVEIPYWNNDKKCMCRFVFTKDEVKQILVDEVRRRTQAKEGTK